MTEQPVFAFVYLATTYQSSAIFFYTKNHPTDLHNFTATFDFIFSSDNSAKRLYGNVLHFAHDLWCSGPWDWFWLSCVLRGLWKVSRILWVLQLFFVAGMNREMPYMGGCMKSLLMCASTRAYAACERSVGMVCFVVPSFSITKKIT